MKKTTRKNGSPRRTSDSSTREPGREEIAALACSIWEQQGRAPGRDVENWLHAETQLRQNHQPNSVRS